ncbi:MAG: hypothetical protein K0S55_1757 [Clostridia bacterium]|nr:hypothetical protein [Clostridia bacterium]
MQQFDKIHAYSKLVCDQIRWKKAQPVIAEEIENHLIDQKEVYMADNMDEETATAEAIQQMGDPVQVGTELDRVHRPKPEWNIIILTMVALMLGIGIKIFITNSGDFIEPKNAIIAGVIGIVFMVGAYFADYTIIGKFPKTFYFTILIITIFLRVTSNIRDYYYAQYAVLLFPLAYAAFVYSMRGKGYWSLILSGIAYGLLVYVAFLIPSFSQFVIITLSGLVIFCFAIQKGWFKIHKLCGYLMIAVPVFLAAMISKDYIWGQLKIALHPELEAQGTGYINLLVKDILKNSKFISNGEMSKTYFPCMDTDYVLTYLIYQFGWISMILISVLLAAFIIFGFRLCLKQKSILGLLMSLSVMLIFTFQTVFYILANLGFIFTSFSLPLISYGCTATIINMALIGVMLSVFKSGSIVKDKHFEKRTTKHMLISRKNGEFVISFKDHGGSVDV